MLENDGREASDALRPFGELFVAVAQHDLLRARHFAVAAGNREASLASRSRFRGVFDDFRIQIDFERLSRLVEPLYGYHPPQDAHLRGGYPYAGVLRVPHRGEHPAAQRFVIVRTLHALGHRGRFAAERQRIAAVGDRQYVHDSAVSGIYDLFLGAFEFLRAPCERESGGRTQTDSA